MQIESGFVQRHPSGLDLGQRQHVVNQCQQMFATAVDHPQRRPLLGSQSRIAGQQVRETQDRVQRRAQLVADVGQESTLGPTGRLSSIPGLGQVNVLLLQLFGAPGDLGFQRGDQLVQAGHHVVERFGQVADLIVVLDGNHRFQVPFVDPSDSLQ